ncbi:hypothetical protein F503_02837 [Ophiostoma piceae UAMH 11346]|uniref:Uncharacterized protein n=1 Tax=Ophiostoma piceae (strain UAMH 11346) TaxID=1262450 RepID=S3CI25_OPHP1|nr:hypothetical protein F503_02837 [Ophiostoma piceae UAMH 11346]
MGDDNDPPKNPFIRWKQHVDAHIGMTLNGLLGIPTMVSKNMNLHSDVNEPRSTDAASSSANTAPASDGTAAYPSSPLGSASNSDGALDGVDPNQLLEWHKFIYYSPYSPLKLQQQQQLHLLASPVPRDVPFGADPYSFTYADAFEDLLRADSGRPLLDLADRSFRNLHSQLRSGSAIEPPYVFFHRMHSQGLLDAYFPRTTAAAAANALARNSSSANDANDANDIDSVVRAVTALAERDPDLWREQMAEEEADKHYDMGEEDEHYHEHEHDDRYDDDYHDQKDDEARRLGSYDAWAHHDAEQRRRNQAGFGGGGLFDELDRVFRVLGRIIDEDTNGNTNSNTDASSTSAAKRDNSQPNTEDELYDAVRSAYSSAEKSLSTLIKTFSGLSGGNGFDTQNNHYEQSQSSYTGSSSTINNSNSQWQDKKLETTQSTEEHTDVFGNRHVKTVVRRVDADGNEVARETHYTVRSPTPQELAIKEVDDLSDDHQHEDVEKLEAPKPSKPEEKPSGWFWK